MRSVILPVVAVILGISSSAALASDTVEPSEPVTVDAATDAPPADDEAQEPSVLLVPALTPVKIEILADLGSKTSKSLDTFPIRLAEPISVDGQITIPAGAEGMGEVVHAKKGGAMGAPGELILAARYLEVDGRQLPLRSMNFADEGKDNIGAAAAVGITLGLPAFLISGGNIDIPSGTVASAKTRADFTIAAVNEVASADSAEEATPEFATTGNPAGHSGEQGEQKK